MERVDALIDKETLKRSYLFPAIPYSKSLCEQVLSDQLARYSSKPEAILFNIRKVTFRVASALCDTDLKMGENPQPLDFLFALIVSIFTLKRIDGREVDFHNDIKGKKYVMVCILSVPDCCDSLAWEVATKSHELYAQRKDHDDFELVIILRQRIGWEELSSVEDFLKPFHTSCIIWYIGDGSSAYFEDNRVLIIDPNNKVLLQHSLCFMSHVGSAAFPFKEADLELLWNQCWCLNHSSLETLLGVEPSHEFFRKIPGTDPLQEEWRCISEFRSKIVFLYIYHHGNCLALLYDTVKVLRKEGKEFEIITAYVPSCEYHNATQFLEVFSSLVAKDGLSWWVLPYDSSTYPRLRPLYTSNTRTDHLIVFDPKLDVGDPHGLEVIDLYGQSLFPFTKESIVDHVIKQVIKVTLQSLFKYATRLCNEGPEYDTVCTNKSLSVLDGKDVLVYFDVYVSGSSPLDQFVSWYSSLGEKEKRRNNFEVVCVYLDGPNQDDYNIGLRRQFPKWLISSDDDEKACAKYVVDNFFMKLFNRKFSTVVAFNKEGNICSLCAHRLLSSKAVTFPLNGDLRKEIFNISNDYFTQRTSCD